jgi:acyl carrier protein
MELHKLHPALMDTATAFLIDRTNRQQAYLPFFFKRVRIKGALPTILSSYARLKEKGSSQKQALAFDVTITDDTGVELVDIEEMTVLAVSQVPGDNSAAADVSTVSPNPDPGDPLKNAILPHEGVDVFTRVLGDNLHRVTVSTVDLSLRLEKKKDKKASRQESFSEPTHPRPELTTPYAAPGTKTQQVLAAIWQEFMGIRQIGIHDDFFELGADSLKALTVMARIHEKLNVEVSITDIFTSPTIAGLAEYIEGIGENIHVSIPPVEKKEYYPLSSAQTRLYLLQQMQKQGVSYNLPFVYRIEGPLNKTRFENAFRALVQRHESLRTSFHLVNGEPVQEIDEHVDFKVEYSHPDPGVVDIPLFMKEKVRPFDLSQAPLLRVRAFGYEENKHVWLLDIHHIIADAGGYAVLQKDLMKLYNNEELPPLEIQYKDFCAWRHRLDQSKKIKEQEKYWLNRFPDAAEIPILNFPTDYPRPGKLRFKGDRFYFELGAGETLKFKELGARAGATLFAGLLSVLNVLLFKYTGQQDIIIGSMVAGRPHADLRQMVGMFVNMLPMRNQPAPAMTFGELLSQVKTHSLEAFENQDMPFEMLVKQLNLGGDRSRNPLFDICLNVENYEQPKFEIEGLTITHYPHETDTAKFDMLLWANPVGENLHFMLEYSSELFKPSTAEAFSNHFIEIIQQVIADKDITLRDIKISHQLLMPESDVPTIDFGF